MTARISLALVVHNHQPVGNFGWVFEEVYENAYAPMIEALERHPRVKVALHYTGPLLEWMESEHPDSIARLRALVERGQVEILGGGLYEPILVSLPQRDRHDQLRRMRDEVERLFGVAPQGAWLAERVWEPSLPVDLAEAGYRYTVLDDNHLRAAAVPDERMWGTYTTDDQGRLLTIFGTEKGLRYRIPWQPVENLIGYLRSAATEDGARVGIMGDDGEKFGGWPGTHKLCWGREQWIEKCFSALESNESWLRTVTPSNWMATQAPIDRIYVPTASYVEMTQWALPPDQARVFHTLVGEAEAATDKGKEPPKWAPFLRGGLWRNFQARYREINDLHKQMQLASAAVAKMPEGSDKERAADHLHRGQSNDCYWHGLFGGIYIVHMRMATLHHLIAAQDIAAASGVPMPGPLGDFDLDGREEVALTSAGQFVTVDPAEGGGIGRWDLRATRVALASVLRRRPEAYHAKLRSAEAPDGAGDDVSNPHETVHAEEPSLARYLVYDDHERRSALVRVLGPDGRPVGDFVSGEWAPTEVADGAVVLLREAVGVRITKQIVVSGDRMSPALETRLVLAAERGFDGSLELEWNINLSGGGNNPSAYYRWAGGETRHDAPGSAPAGTDLSFGNEYDGVDVVSVAEPAAEVSWAPVDTVSNSEAGFERTYQGSCVTYQWPLQLAAGDSRSFEVRFTTAQSRDRFAEELG